MATFLSCLALCLFVFAISVGGMFAPSTGESKNPVGDGSIGITSVSTSRPKPLRQRRIPKNVYFDWTAPLDNILNGDRGDSSFFEDQAKEGSKPHVPNVFYTTDSLVSNLADLSPVTDLLDKNELPESPLYLSFRYLHGNNISEDRMGDVFFPFDISIPEDKLPSLKKHVSGIVLDFQSNISFCEHAKYFKGEELDKILRESWRGPATSKWNTTPFPKYAKKIMQKLLPDSTIKVGVAYTEYQISCSNLVQQQKHADFLVINVRFAMDWIFPKTYFQFSTYLETLRKAQIAQLIQNESEGEDAHSKKEIMFKLDFEAMSPLNLEYMEKDTPGSTKIVEETQLAYNLLFKEFVRQWTGMERSELIINHGVNTTMSDEAERELSPKIHSGDWFTLYLNVQEVEVTACQLRSMLGRIADHNVFKSVVVNEYTWTAFARYEKDMTPENCNGMDLPPNPPETYLLFSSGIRKSWNETEAFFQDLLQNHQTIAGWRLNTILFSSKDLKCTASGNDDHKSDDNQSPSEKHQLIPQFAAEMQGEYKIGCFVEFEELPNYKLEKNATWLRDTTIDMCKPLWDLSSVIIWQFNVTLGQSDMLSMTMRIDKFTFWAIALRTKAFREEYPEKEVILQINIPNAGEFIRKDKENYPDLPCGPSAAALHDFYQEMGFWASTYGIKVIIAPAFHVEEPTRGFWMPPAEDGTSSTFYLDSCKRHYKVKENNKELFKSG